MAVAGLATVRPAAGNPYAPRYQGGAITNPFPGTHPGGGGGGSTNRLAVEGAKNFRDTLGLPSYQDLLGKFGGGTGTREFGNAGAAGEGADFAKGELSKFRGDLHQSQSQLAAERSAIRNPTKTEGFRNVMRLTNERAGQAAEAERRQAAAAASRRGYVGGYSPGQTEQNRLEAVATAGYEAADKERAAQQALFNAEGDLYGKEMGGYSSALGAYTDLTKAYAELPTKYLDAYSNLLGGMGGYGDIFGTASRNVQFDVGNEREDTAQRRSARNDQIRLMRSMPGAAGSI